MHKWLNWKNIIFFITTATFAISVCALAVLWFCEKDARTIFTPQPLQLSGVYYTEDDPEERPLTSGEDFNLPGVTSDMTFVGNFSREIAPNEIISFKLDNLYIKMFVNEELIYSYGAPGSVLPFSRSPGNGWQYISSAGISPSDQIVIEIQNHYSYRGNHGFQSFFNGIFIGNPAAQISFSLQSASFTGFIAIFILLMGMFEFVYAIALILSKERADRFFTLAGLSVFGGLWFLVDFNVMELFIPYPIFNNAIQNLSLCLMSCYMLLYVATALTGFRKGCIRVSACCLIAIILASIITQFRGSLDFYDYVPLLYIVLYVMAAEVLLMLCWEHHLKDSKGKREIIPFFLLMLGAVADVILRYFGIFTFAIFELSLCLFNCWQLYCVWKLTRDFSVGRAQLQLLQQDHERQQRLLEYQLLLSNSTKGLYESIYELDITHNCAGGESTTKYFESLGLPGNASYDQALRHIAAKQVQEPFRQEYLDTFSPAAVLEKYNQGIDALEYDFLTATDGENYYWMRINARIFLWNDDKSVRMIIYRQNVDEEKRRELLLISRAQIDPLTGLHNRETSEQQAREFLSNRDKTPLVCCIMLDIDNFKGINDTFGHMAGDFALTEFSRILKNEFSSAKVIGRLGGDEFIIFTSADNEYSVIDIAEKFQQELVTSRIQFEHKRLPLSSSIGIAFLPKEQATFEILYRRADNAMYQSKKHGKNCYTIYSK